MEMNEIVTRSQTARGSGQFKGPDAYMAVVNIPEGGEKVGEHPLSEANRVKYGWKVFIIGEYYAKSTGPRSKYAGLMDGANVLIERLVSTHNIN